MNRYGLQRKSKAITQLERQTTQQLQEAESKPPHKRDEEAIRRLKKKLHRLQRAKKQAHKQLKQTTKNR